MARRLPLHRAQVIRSKFLLKRAKPIADVNRAQALRGERFLIEIDHDLPDLPSVWSRQQRAGNR